MITRKFMSPADIASSLDEITQVYSAAFGGEPWNEKSKCPDSAQRCVGGLSAVAVNNLCQICQLCPDQPAYTQDELSERFDKIAQTRFAWWYTERTADNLALAGFAWSTSPETIYLEKYSDVPDMEQWLTAKLGSGALVWLDEVFADRSVRRQGNLKNFGPMCRGFMERLEVDRLAFRTINERMLAVSTRDFGTQANIFRSGTEVPDRRSFVLVERKEQA